MKRGVAYTIFTTIAGALIVSCSTTKRLVDDQVLYTGVKKIEIESMSDHKVSGNTKSDAKSPLLVKPNNPLWSPYVRTPIPMGLWVWNYMYTDRKKGFNAWIYRLLGKPPVLIEQVKPEARAGMVEDILDNLGYFGSQARYELLPKKNPKKARVSYFVDVAEPWFYETVEFPPVKDSLTREIARMEARSNIKPAEQYNIDTLNRERVRITNTLRNNSYYYFRPDYIDYFADTTRVRYGVDLKLRMAKGVPEAALRPYEIGDIRLTVFSADNSGELDSVNIGSAKLVYQKPLKLRAKVLERALTIKPGDPARIPDIDRTLSNLTRLGVFRHVSLAVTPLDSLKADSALDLNFTASLDTPMEAEIEVDFASKSNSFLGPALILGLKHKNIFRGGETLSFHFNGSYEWQTGNKSSSVNSSAVNSYEFGLTTSLVFPRMIVPKFITRAMEHGGTTSYALSSNLLNRPQYFSMLSVTLSNIYDFRTSSTVTHSFTPLQITFNRMLRRTAGFDELLEGNDALKLGFQDQFIPSGTYTYTFDKRLGYMRRDRLSWSVSLTGAGNILSGACALFGVKGEKRILGLPFSQFFRETTELKYFKQIARLHTFAVRLFVGAGHAYGNSSVLPYNEQFYIGGAYSIRAFTIRSIGPGSYRDPSGSYLTQMGEFKLELNAEMRFRIAGGLHGALFLDAGNVWLLKENSDRPGGKLTSRGFFRELATGSGAGLRYDLGFLVIRADLGIGIHLPYDTGKSGYYNIPRFKDGLGFHVAIGYPF